MVGIRSRHLAVDAVFLGLDGIARRITQGHYGAQAVEVIVVDGIAVLDVYHTERLVNTRAVDVFSHQVVTVVVFGYNVVAVIEVFGGYAVDDILIACQYSLTLRSRINAYSFSILLI